MIIVRNKIWPLLFLLPVFSCSRDDDGNQIPSFPTTVVNEQINLKTLPYSRDLNRDNTFVYLNAGVRGIVLYRETENRYFAYERNCTYQPYDACAKVTVDPSGFFMQDTCCSSKFDMRGNVIGGPALYPLRQYSTARSGDLLYIRN